MAFATCKDLQKLREELGKPAGVAAEVNITGKNNIDVENNSDAYVVKLNKNQQHFDEDEKTLNIRHPNDARELPDSILDFIPDVFGENKITHINASGKKAIIGLPNLTDNSDTQDANKNPSTVDENTELFLETVSDGKDVIYTLTAKQKIAGEIHIIYDDEGNIIYEEHTPERTEMRVWRAIHNGDEPNLNNLSKWVLLSPSHQKVPRYSFIAPLMKDDFDQVQLQRNGTLTITRDDVNSSLNGQLAVANSIKTTAITSDNKNILLSLIKEMKENSNVYYNQPKMRTAHAILSGNTTGNYANTYPVDALGMPVSFLPDVVDGQPVFAPKKPRADGDALLSPTDADKPVAVTVEAVCSMDKLVTLTVTALIRKGGKLKEDAIVVMQSVYFEQDRTPQSLSKEPTVAEFSNWHYLNAESLKNALKS